MLSSEDDFHLFVSLLNAASSSSGNLKRQKKEADFGFYSCVAAWEGGQVEEQVQQLPSVPADAEEDGL